LILEKNSQSGAPEGKGEKLAGKKEKGGVVSGKTVERRGPKIATPPVIQGECGGKKLIEGERRWGGLGGA